MKRLLCAIFGHRYALVREFRFSRMIACKRCRQRFGMHDQAITVIPWDAELEEMYRVTGQL